MKRVLRIVTSLYNPNKVTDKSVGGTQIQVYRLTSYLAEHILQDIFTFEPTDFNHDNINVFCYKYTMCKYYKSFYDLYRIIKKTKYDYIHIHANGSLFPLIIGEYIRILLKIPIIYTFHCCRNATYIGNKIEVFIIPIINFIEKNCIRNARCNIFLSKNVVERLNDKGVIVNNTNYEIIGDAVIDVIANDLNQKSSKKNIFFIGRLSREKGWDIFVKIANMMQDRPYNFHMYGSGKDRKKLMKMISKYNLSNLYYHGNVPNLDIFEKLKSADIVIIPSYYEELGSIVLEAGIMKKIVIASYTGPLGDILSCGRGYLVNVGNVIGFCNAINQAVSDGNKEMGEKLYQYIRENYLLAESINKHISLYESY